MGHVSNAILLLLPFTGFINKGQKTNGDKDQDEWDCGAHLSLCCETCPGDEQDHEEADDMEDEE
jgi:hypothetical protein